MTWGVLGGAWLVALAISPWQPVTTDEAWFLVVARRLRDGDRLYRDVFFGAGPLAPVIAALACAIARPQLLVTRAVVAGYIAVGAAAAHHAITSIGGAPTAALLVAAGIVLLAGPHVAPHNHYGHLTSAAVVGAGAAITTGHPMVAGALVGVAAAGRYPFGLLAALALAPAVREDLLVFAGSALAATAVLYLPLGGDLRWFFLRAVANKSTYLRVGRLSPLEWMRTIARRRGADLAASLPSVGGLTVVVIAAAAGLGGAITGVARVDDTLMLGAGLCVVGVAATFPRFDAAHVVAALPTAATGAALVSLTTVGAGPVTVVASLAVATGAVGYLARMDATRSISRDHVRRDLASLRTTPVVNHHGPWPDDTDCVIRHGHSVLVLTPDAPLVYAAGGLTNPTPFDYPLASTFGPHGQLDVADRLRDGSIIALVRWAQRDSPHAPAELLNAADALWEVDRCDIGSVRRASPAIG